MDEENLSVPDYKYLLNEAKYFVVDRGGLLSQRVLLIGWPALAYVGILAAVAAHAKAFGDQAPMLDGPFGRAKAGVLVGLFPVAFLYVLVLTHIFALEKILWIDASFDHKNLEPEQSWRIARRLFWPSFTLRLIIFFKYYFAFLFVYFFALFLYLRPLSIVGWEPTSPIYSLWFFVSVFIVGGPIFFYAYCLYLSTKLRYIWFIFLDNYGAENFSHSSIFSEMKKLNEINQSDFFKKALTANLGITFLQDVVQLSVGAIILKLVNSFFKKRNRFTVGGAVVGAYFSETASQTSSLAKATANYVLYRYCRYALYRQPQKTNEHVYALV